MEKLEDLKKMLSAVSGQSAATSVQVDAVITELPLFKSSNGNGTK